MKKIISVFLLCFSLVNYTAICSLAEEKAIEVKAPSALLMDYSTGEILYEKNADEKMPLASVTKIMTMLLGMEEIESGRLSFNDIITASAHAKSYGGSTIFLEEGEQMSVSDIIKGIAVASGNDAAVALGEHISGTESLFVEKMNKRASELGMKNTNFVNCNGLDADGHYSSARDIAIMSRELMKHEDIFKYTTIWMDSLRDGAFTLSNTNKLVRFYEGCTGLKTGSTGKAKFCISATAKRGDMHLIAVIMGAETSKERQSDASSLLNYGFASYTVKNIVKKNDEIISIQVPKSPVKTINAVCEEDYSMIFKKEENPSFELKEEINKIKAPINKGDAIGSLNIYINGKKTHSVNLIADNSAPKLDFPYMLKNVITHWLN